MTDDVRVIVVLEETGLPWPLRFYFLRTEEGWVNVGFEIGTGPVTRAGIVDLDSEDTEITAAAFRRITEDFYRYRRIALAQLDIREGPVSRAVQAADSLDRESLERYAHRYRLNVARGGQKGDLFRELGFSRPKEWRWRKRCKELGLLNPDE